MTNNNADPTPAPRKRRGRTIFVDGPPERGNATAEELTWPVVSFVQRGRSVFIDGPPERGNATPEELTWPVAGTGSHEGSAPRPVPASDVKPSRKPDRSWIWELLPEVRLHLAFRLRNAGLDSSIADDLVHDAAVAVFEQPLTPLPTATTEARLSYLKRKAFVRVAEYARPRFWTKTSADEFEDVRVDGPTASMDSTETSTLIKALLDKLSPGERKVIELRYFAQRTCQEIGSALGIHESTARERLNRARQHLRTLIQTDFPELADALDDK